MSSTAGAGLEAHLTPALLRDVHAVWFEHLGGPEALVLPSRAHLQRWFSGGAELDRVCQQRFAPALEAVRRGTPSGPAVLDAVRPVTARDWLSLVLLLDQVPRNCYRGDAAAVAYNVFDPLARHVTLAAMGHGVPHRDPEVRWRLAYRNWFYLPLMHAEDLASHDRAVREYARMRDDVAALAEAETDAADEHRAAAAAVVRANADEAARLVQSYMDFETAHRDIIQRFGRFPHRNRALGRPPTTAETEYLDGGGQTFGS